jgi:hypothetical protein
MLGNKPPDGCVDSQLQSEGDHNVWRLRWGFLLRRDTPYRPRQDLLDLRALMRSARCERTHQTHLNPALVCAWWVR